MGRYSNDIIERCSFRLLLSKGEREREAKIERGESERDNERDREGEGWRQKQREGEQLLPAASCYEMTMSG